VIKKKQLLQQVQVQVRLNKEDEYIFIYVLL
jgi:hypothetical protein